MARVSLSVVLSAAFLFAGGNGIAIAQLGSSAQTRLAAVTSPLLAAAREPQSSGNRTYQGAGPIGAAAFQSGSPHGGSLLQSGPLQGNEPGMSPPPVAGDMRIPATPVSGVAWPSELHGPAAMPMLPPGLVTTPVPAHSRTPHSLIGELPRSLAMPVADRGQPGFAGPPPINEVPPWASRPPVVPPPSSHGVSPN